jgi:hypothetical protein
MVIIINIIIIIRIKVISHNKATEMVHLETLLIYKLTVLPGTGTQFACMGRVQRYRSGYNGYIRTAVKHIHWLFHTSFIYGAILKRNLRQRSNALWKVHSSEFAYPISGEQNVSSYDVKPYRKFL